MPQVTIEQVIASPRLPSLPAVAVRIIDLVQRPDVSIEQLATVIANDAPRQQDSAHGELQLLRPPPQC